ncbi:hypothetical protein [Mariniphaga sp.]|uniref:hypothetical protein n=1 Tax=Mariniphaga sp. TaxID=1954475 RepID=UPI003567FB34
MDLGTIIITLVFIAIVTVPFILTGYSRKRKKKNLFHRLTQMAGNEGCTITHHEFCADFVIGLDGMANRLFFYKKVETLEIAKSLHLREFKSCKVINSNRTVENKKEKYYVVDKLDLIFYPTEKGAPEISIELYNDEYDSLTLTGELQLAEKWEKLLNEQLKSPPKPKAGTDNRPNVTASLPAKQKPRKSVAA